MTTVQETNNAAALTVIGRITADPSLAPVLLKALDAVSNDPTRLAALTAAALETLKAALPEATATTTNSCELGSGMVSSRLDPKITALLNTYFERVSLPENGLEFKTRAVADKNVSDLVTELTGLVKTIHGINLTPSGYLVGTITNYDQALTVIEDRQVFGVEGSHNKNREQMQTHLSEQRPSMSFAKRENGASVVGVLLKTLLTGENPLKNQELRDSVGALYSDAYGLGGNYWGNGAVPVNYRLRSFGSRN